MFKIGDKVIDVGFSHRAENAPGIVRAKYGHHYLVSWPDWRRISSEQEADLVPADSPFLDRILDLARREHELSKQYRDGVHEVYAEMRRIAAESRQSHKKL